MATGAKMSRVKVTGYLTLKDGEEDFDSPTGLTEEAYIDIIHDEMGGSPKVSDLEDVEVELE